MTKSKIEPIEEVELGGKNYKLKYNHLALFAIQETEGVNFMHEFAVQVREQKIELRSLIILLWACLLTDWEELDVRQEDQLRSARRKVALLITNYKSRVKVTTALILNVAASSVLPPTEDEKQLMEETEEKKVQPVLGTGEQT